MDSIDNIKKQFNMMCSAIMSNRFDVDTKIQLIDYYDVYLELLENFYDHGIVTNAERYLNDSEIDKCILKKRRYWNTFAKNMINNIDFHNSYLSEILNHIDCNFDFEFVDVYLSRNDFFELGSLFAKSINQEELFNKIYKSGSICFLDDLNYDSSLGFTISNPINNKLSVFLEGKYSIFSLETLIHEFGHCYDISNLNLNSKDYNKYGYYSIYGEVLSRLFERLLLRFLLKEGIYEDEVRANYAYFILNNNELLKQTYYASSIDKKRLSKLLYTDEDYYLSNEFLDNKDISKDDLDLLKQLDHISIKGSFDYTYGNIISLFLCDEIEKNGFNLDTLNNFMKNRTNLFDESFILESGYTPYDYIEFYDKEVQLMKK